MSITTYAELQAAVADFLNREDLTVIPTFISLAEARLNRDLKHWKMEVRSEATFNQQYEVLPSDWRTAKRVALLNDVALRNEGSEKILKYRSESALTGKPCFYAIVGGQIELYPTPDGDYDGEMVYYANIPALSDSNTSNWLLAYAPDVYLYGTMMHTAPYLGDDDRLTWAALYQSGIDELNEESAAAEYSGSTLVMK